MEFVNLTVKTDIHNQQSNVQPNVCKRDELQSTFGRTFDCWFECLIIVRVKSANSAEVNCVTKSGNVANRGM